MRYVCTVYVRKTYRFYFYNNISERKPILISLSLFGVYTRLSSTR